MTNSGNSDIHTDTNTHTDTHIHVHTQIIVRKTVSKFLLNDLN